MQKRRHRNRKEQLDPRVWAWLAHGIDDDSLVVFIAQDRVRELWAEHGTKATAEFVKANPGRRPPAWWQCSAPEPRRRLGGRGTPCHTALNYTAHLEFGVPVSWLQPGDWLHYNGQVRDHDGALIDTGYVLGDLPCQPIDRNDLPLYESQPAYLRRLGLLLPGELARLCADDFRPERLTDAFEDELDDWRELIEDVVTDE